MKKYLSFFALVAVVAMTLISCSKESDNTPVNEDGAQMKTIKVRTGIATKTTLNSDHSNLLWSTGDKISLFNNVNTTNTQLSYSAGEYIEVTVPTTTTEIYMHYPYYNGNTSGPTSASVYIDAAQTQVNPGELAGKYYPMVAKGTVTSDNKAIVQFYPVAGALALNIYNTGLSGTETVQSVTVTPDGANTGFIGRQTTNLTSDNIKYSSTSGTNTSVTVTLTNGLSLSNTAPANKKTFDGQIYVCLAKQSYKSVKFEITTDKCIYTITSSSTTAFDLVNNDFVPVNINLARASYVKKIYSTSFDYPLVKEGGSTLYNTGNQYEGVDPGGKTSWYITYGNWADGNSAQFRIYNGTGGGFGELAQKFDCSEVKYVTYEARANNSNATLTLTPYYSTDKGSTWTAISADAQEMTTTSTKYTFTVSPTGEHSRVRVKLVISGTRPASSNTQVTIDNLIIFGNGAILEDPSISADNISDVPAFGVTSTLSYTLNNFSGSDDVTATCDGTVVSSASVTSSGTVTYTVAPNYETSAKSGSITLTSTTAGVSKEVRVSQPGETFSVSSETITILKDATSETFTITTPTFGWATTVTPEEGKNLSSTPTSGDGNTTAQTITVNSTTSASASEQTLGTIVVYRNGNTSDPQKKTITIKKASNIDAATYTKVTSITSGAEYLVCETTANKIINGYNSNHLSTTAVTITGGTTITGNDDIDSYTFIITALTGDDSGYYSIYFKNTSKYIGYSSGTNYKQSTSVSDNSYKWSISIDENGVATITNKETSARYWGYNGSSDFRPYSNGSGYNNTRPVLFKKD